MIRIPHTFLSELHEHYRRGLTLAEIGEIVEMRAFEVRRLFLRRGLAVERDERSLHCWPRPQAQPTTPLRGEVGPVTFADYVAARTRQATPAVQALYDAHGAYACKPKRRSVGVVWNGRAFWWSVKGYYRNGRGGKRRPLQHLIWERHHGRAVPPGHEVFFTDRDRHNFQIENLELLSKADLHRRVHALGETRSLTFEERSEIRGTWATKKSRNLTALLLQRAQQPKQNHDLTQTLHAQKTRRQDAHTPAAR